MYSFFSTVSVTPCALMLALMYVKRLKDTNNSQYLSQVSSTDLFLISVASTTFSSIGFQPHFIIGLLCQFIEALSFIKAVLQSHWSIRLYILQSSVTCFD